MSLPLREVKKTGNSGLSLLAFPAPYRAWLSISNDPDHTTIERWKELHSFIWEELKLPLGDAIFTVSHNQNLPNQISLAANPEISGAHLYDTLHFWGDYMHSRKVNFDREEAINNIAILKRHNIHPLVWVDHSSHRGNLMHSSTIGTKPVTRDASGHVYQNFLYTLDLVAATGIRYIWDGEATNFIGQDVDIPRMQWYGDKMPANKALAYTLMHTLLSPVLKKFPWKRFSHGRENNLQYSKYKFADGQTLYCFRRYGIWKLADIDGLAKVISKININRLINRGGTCIVYTHLGKRIAGRESDTVHIPEATRNAIRYLRDKFAAEELMISPVSKLLDYLVIRDNIKLTKDTLTFMPDGIRFSKINSSDLEHHTFGIKMRDPSRLRVVVDGKEVKFALSKINGDYFNIQVRNE